MWNLTTIIPHQVQYNGAALLEGTQADMDAAEEAVAAACRKNRIWAIIGLPHYYDPHRYNGSDNLPLPSCCTPEKCWYNTGLVIDDTGTKTYRQAKMHSAGPDGQLGVWLDTFKVARNVTASLQICYDAYFPHMTLLPVLKGSRLTFDLSSERGYDSDAYYQTIGALYQGRTQESGVHLVQANTGAAIRDTPGMVHVGTFAGSHGNSQIISTDGHVLARATHTQEQIVYADVSIEAAAPPKGGFAETNPVFKSWLRSGLDLIGNRMPLSLHTGDNDEDRSSSSPLKLDDAGSGGRRAPQAGSLLYCDSGQNCSVVLQSAIDEAAGLGGGGRVSLAAGTWEVVPIVLRSDLLLELEAGVNIIAQRGSFYSTDSMLLSAGCGIDPAVKNLTIRGAAGGGSRLAMRRSDYANASLYSHSEERHAICMSEVVHILVVDLEIIDTGGDGIYISGGDHEPSIDVALLRVTTRNAYRNGLSITNARDVVVRDCQFLNTSGTPPVGP
jgi:predicted amidohydrolase